MARKQADHVEIKDKVLLTLNEASAYTNIGTSSLEKIAKDPECDFVFYVGNRRLFKRVRLERFIVNHDAI